MRRVFASLAKIKQDVDRRVKPGDDVERVNRVAIQFTCRSFPSQ